MRFAVISDIHANLEALEAVLSHIGDLPVLCLGDLVGYGAQPNEVIERLRHRALRVVMGNHDLACADGTRLEYFNPSAAWAAEWTHGELTPANVDWLLALPYVVSEPTFALVHGSPDAPEDFGYILDYQDALHAFVASDDVVTFVGHSHMPCVFELGNGVEPDRQAIIGERTITLHPNSRYIVNVGSTGQPRDSDPRASYVVYDDTARTVTWNRVAYDVAGAQAKIRATSLPASCAERLEFGR